MNRLIDFSSRFRILKGGKISLVVSAFLGGAIIANAAPSGGTVTSGNATINQSGNITNINQSSSKASINWNNFSVKANEIVNFNQPNVNSITLNRVIGTEKSVIDGALNANGQVWILNSNGILFGKNASVNTAGLLATTAQLSDADFQAGNYNFKNSSSNSVINLGTIKVQNSSYVILAGKEVQNGGNIEAVKGKVHLVGADSYSINLNGNSLVNLRVNKGVLDSLVTNSGNILANGGEIFLTTNAVDELLKGVVNNTGIIEANSLDGITGKVELFAHGGEVQVGGTIEAKDGFVETSGKEFKVKENATVKAGEWLIDPVDITIDDTLATTIETALGTGNVTIETTTPSITGETIANENQTSTDGNTTDGDIYVNSEITWSSANKLTLDAADSIYINSAISATAGQLALYYGDSGDYYVNAQVNLSAGDNFFTKQTSDGSETTWTVITDLGSAGSTTGTDLQGINGNLLGNYVLGANIDASATSTWNVGDHDGDAGEFTTQVPMGWTPIGNATAFTGNFDGLGHTISNLYINRPTENLIGLFGFVNYGSTIKNLGVTNVNITGKDNVGTVVGSYFGSTIQNLYSTGTVNGTKNVGGLVGFNQDGKIKNSYSMANVLGINYIGGLVGYSYSMGQTALIENSYASGNVTGTGTNLAGLVNNVHGTTITNSYYDQESNSSFDMADISNGKIKSQILTAFSEKDAWLTSGASFAGYATNTIVLPQLLTFFTPTATLFDGGMGSEANPYTITNWTQLQNINNGNILTQNYFFSLLNNLSSSTSDYTDLASSTANDGAGWNPIGYYVDESNQGKFIGIFDGQNYTIDSLYINRASEGNIALFGFNNGGSFIKNIGLTNVNIVGGHATAALVGINAGKVSNSYATGDVTGTTYTGGLVGHNYTMYSNMATISNSYSKVNVSGTQGVGGLLGVNMGTISNSYATGDTQGIEWVGGFVGANLGNISNSYSIGDVSLTEGTSVNIGGFIGANMDPDTAIVTNSFYDKDTSNQTVGIGGTDASQTGVTGLTTEEFKDSSNFTKTGVEWDDTIWTFGDSSVEGYEVSFRPYLKDVTAEADKPDTFTLFAGGFGTSDDAYEITNWTQLQNINNSNILTQGYYFSLLNNLGSSTSDYTDLASSTANSGTGWNPIGNGTIKFTGNFDGNNYNISNLFINRPTEDYIGLFGSSATASTIKNLGLSDVNITGKGYIGALVGQNYGTISKVYAIGDLSASSYYVGGLVGSNSGTIDNSYSDVDVTSGAGYMGGLVGYNWTDGNISYSYSIGSVEESSNNGFAGGNEGTITNSFWDITTSGKNSSAGGDGLIGLTTEAFKNSLLFSAWDFSNTWSYEGQGDTVEGYGVTSRPYLKNVTAQADKPTQTTLFQNGFGTSENPYGITSWAQLQSINFDSNVTTNNYSFKLLNDLDNSMSDWNYFVFGDGGWNPIGNSTNKFTGTFNGNNKTIGYLYILREEESNLGLFGYTDNATIKNLGLSNVYWINGKNNVGSLVGTASNTTISNVYATAYIDETNNFKGLVYGDYGLGGLVGYLHDESEVSNSYASIDVLAKDGTSYGYGLGGLVGSLNNLSKISNSYATGNVTGTSHSIGGLVGVSMNDSIVENSYTRGDVIGRSSVGGIVGHQSGGSIINTYAVGKIEHTGTNSYDTSGAILGYRDDVILSNNFYDEETTGQTIGIGGAVSQTGTEGKTTKQMQTFATFDDAQWNVELDATLKKIYPYLTFDENGNATWKIGKYSTGLNYILGTANTTYDGTNQSLTNFWTNAIFGDVGSSLVAGIDYKFVYDSENATVFKNAGTYNNISVVILNEDYELDETGTNTLGKFVIAKKDATVTANSDTKTYNGLTQNVSGFTATGLVNGETESVLTGISGATASGKNAGEYVTTLSGTDGNYNLTFVDGKLTISKANATVTANSNTVAYNGQIQNVNGFTASGLVNGETESVLTGITGATASGKNAGEYVTTLSGTDGNYNLTFVDGKLTISKANATVTANSNTVTYNGQTQNVNGFTASGLVNGETESVLTGITGATASGKNAGEYVTTLSGTDGNYNLTFVDGKLVIEKAKDNLSNVLTPIANTTVTTPKVNVVIPPQVPFTQTPTFLNNGTPVNLVSAPIQNQPITMVSMGELRLNQDSNILSASNDIRVPVGDNSKIELVNGGVNLPNGVEQQFFVVGNEEN